MPIDPAAGFATTPEGRTLERISALEREQRANPGAQAAYDLEAATVSTTSAGYVDLGGPSIDLLVPEGGAFVQLYAELEGRDANASGSPARATIYEPTDFPAGSSYMEWNSGAAWQIRRLAPFTGNPAAVGGATKDTLGAFCTYWATPGLRTYSLRYLHLLGNLAEFRNRRLWGRVAY